MSNGLKDTGDHIILTKNDNYYLKTDQLAGSITDGTLTERERVDSIFSWIVNHVDYDREAYQNGLSSSEDPQEVICSRKAVCTGFSNLFAALCRFNEIDVRVVTGYARGAGHRDGSEFVAPNHAWNSVKIDGKWYLADVSWASAYRMHLIDSDSETSGIAFPLSTYSTFYLAEPENFVLSHLPEDPVWQLLAHPVSLNTFEKGHEYVKKEICETTGEIFDYKTEILRTSRMDFLDARIISLERSVENRHNQYREYNLGIAYYYKARRMIEVAQHISTPASSSIVKQAYIMYRKSLFLLSSLNTDISDYEFAFLLANNIKMRIQSHEGQVVF